MDLEKLHYDATSPPYEFVKITFDFEFHTNLDDGSEEDYKKSMSHIASFLEALRITFGTSSLLHDVISFGYEQFVIECKYQGDDGFSEIIDQAEDFKQNMIPAMVKQNNRLYDIVIKEFSVDYSYEIET